MDVRLSENVQSGTLYIISTPIGNLKDITLRALDILAKVDVIAAEDTRTSSKLLGHYHINTALIPYHDHNKERVTPQLLQQLQEGEAIAIVSDAGTPGISDPAFYLVREAVQNQIPIIPIPGAAALLPALVASGLPTDRFVFEGFLPPKKGRKSRLGELELQVRTIILYESPYRLSRTIKDLFDTLGDRPLVIARELTKKFEQIWYGSLEKAADSLEEIPLKGEFVLIVGGLTKKLKRSKKLL
jgi:16S rRNA (cytidine1402-2'-O)-methyltransferase